VSTDVTAVLEQPEWQERERRHRQRVEPWVAPRRERRSRGVSHPVDDFLFDYYPYSVGRLITWHPGHHTALRGDVDQFLAHPDYASINGGAATSAERLTRHRARLTAVERLLSATADREPQLGCFGMHEWAMVYRQEPAQVRHNAYALRLPPDDIADVVNGVGLRCTHFDAYRFFTPAAAPLNAHVPTRAAQRDFEQPGCLHATMDLYKYAQWFFPFIPSELVADCFDLARSARDLDMRASPYDLADLGYEPIRVETADGRRTYVRMQVEVADQGRALRVRLQDLITQLLAES
jgi:hypothetical protein